MFHRIMRMKATEFESGKYTATHHSRDCLHCTEFKEWMHNEVSATNGECFPPLLEALLALALCFFSGEAT